MKLQYPDAGLTKQREENGSGKKHHKVMRLPLQTPVHEISP